VIHLVRHAAGVRTQLHAIKLLLRLHIVRQQLYTKTICAHRQAESFLQHTHANKPRIGIRWMDAFQYEVKNVTNLQQVSRSERFQHSTNFAFLKEKVVYTVSEAVQSI